MELLDTYGVAHGIVEYDTGADLGIAFEARPANAGIYPGIVMVHEFWGLNYHMKDVACRLAAQGYVVVVPDLYDKMGGPVREIAKARENSSKLADTDAVRDLQGAVMYLRQRSYVQSDKITAWGLCMGGRLALLLAGNDQRVGSCIVFYGDPVNDSPNEIKSMNPLQLVGGMQGPLLGVFGAEDKNITPEKANRLQTALKEAGIRYDIHIFPNAGHAFFNDTRGSYHDSSAQQAWNLVQIFLKQSV